MESVLKRCIRTEFPTTLNVSILLLFNGLNDFLPPPSIDNDTAEQEEKPEMELIIDPAYMMKTS